MWEALLGRGGGGGGGGGENGSQGTICMSERRVGGRVVPTHG